MALGWLSAFSDAAQASFSALRSAAAQNLSADTVYRYLRESGVEVARAEVREIVGRLKFDNAVKDYIGALSDSARPLKDYIPETATNLTKTYKYTLEVVGRNVETGEAETRVLSLTTDSLISKGRARELMTTAIESRLTTSKITVESADVTFIEQRAR